MCVLVYTDSALHNADADPDEEGSDDEWLAKAKKGIRVGSQHDALVCVVTHGDLKKTIWSVSVAEARACRDAFDLAITRNQFGTKPLSQEKCYYKENGRRSTITDCKSLFDCLAKDASVPEDRRTALTVEFLRGRCSVGVGRDQKR